MKRALSLVSTSVGLIALLGCAGDMLVAPTNADVRRSSTVSEPASMPVAPAIPVLAPPLTRTALGAPRYAREQLLGFQNNIPTTECLGEGESIGPWQLRFSGYGCVSLTAGASGTALSMQPASASRSDETHAPLLLGPAFGDELTMMARIETVEQLRQDAAPNPWEVAWILWQYQDDAHFYYFIPKPNGWEIGKRDPAYPGGQRFLATGTEQRFPVGQTYNVLITHRGNVFSVVVDGVPLASFTDTERPYVSGRIALYSEDAAVRVHQVSARGGAL